MERKRHLGLVLLAVSLAACRMASAESATTASPAINSAAQHQCSGYTCDGPGAKLKTPYPYRLFTHCGVLETRFDGRSFYVEAIDPSTVTSGLANPEDIGAMTLVSAHLAVFRSSVGSAISFVDTPPGVIGLPYPFRAYVQFGGNQLIDRGFAGRVWRALGTLPGVVGPPSGNSQDRFTVVDGTMTLTGPQAALFRASSGAQVQFVPKAALGCD